MSANINSADSDNIRYIMFLKIYLPQFNFNFILFLCGYYYWLGNITSYIIIVLVFIQVSSVSVHTVSAVHY